MLGIGAILVAEAAAFAYAIVPDVTPTYRAVPIDRTSACIPKSATGTFTPGATIVLDRSGDRSAFEAVRVCGFTDPGSGGSATVGPEARLRLSHDGALTLTIEARSFSDLPRIVHVAGSRLEIPREFTALSIPLAAPSDGVTELEFRTEPLPGAIGARWRGILVRSLRFDPAQ